MPQLTEKINITRFCDLQGVNDFDRRMMERKFKDLVALYSEWHVTVTKEGFTIGPLKKDLMPAAPEVKAETKSTENKK